MPLRPKNKKTPSCLTEETINSTVKRKFFPGPINGNALSSLCSCRWQKNWMQFWIMEKPMPPQVVELKVDPCPSLSK